MWEASSQKTIRDDGRTAPWGNRGCGHFCCCSWCALRPPAPRHGIAFAERSGSPPARSANLAHWCAGNTGRMPLPPRPCLRGSASPALLAGIERIQPIQLAAAALSGTTVQQSVPPTRLGVFAARRANSVLLLEPLSAYWLGKDLLQSSPPRGQLARSLLPYLRRQHPALLRLPHYYVQSNSSSAGWPACTAHASGWTRAQRSAHDASG